MSERKDTFQKETLFDKKYRTNPAIVSMEMRQRMIIVVHVERYSIKNRDYWHTAGSSRANTRVGGAATPPICVNRMDYFASSRTVAAMPFASMPS